MAALVYGFRLALPVVPAYRFPRGSENKSRRVCADGHARPENCRVTAGALNKVVVYVLPAGGARPKLVIAVAEIITYRVCRYSPARRINARNT